MAIRRGALAGLCSLTLAHMVATHNKKIIPLIQDCISKVSRAPLNISFIFSLCARLLGDSIS